MQDILLLGLFKTYIVELRASQAYILNLNNEITGNPYSEKTSRRSYSYGSIRQYSYPHNAFRCPLGLNYTVLSTSGIQEKSSSFHHRHCH